VRPRLLCLPRKLLFTVVDCIDNATMYVYVALASRHYEGNTTYAGPYLAKLTGKDERAIRLRFVHIQQLAQVHDEGLSGRQLTGRDSLPPGNECLRCCCLCIHALNHRARV
jgi:hypothetical protein